MSAPLRETPISAVEESLTHYAPTTHESGYRSPLMDRMAGLSRLTLEFLAEEVPVFQAGAAADVRLATEDLSPDERRRLIRVRSAGETAKEHLLFAAIPLIKHLAQREYQRRQNWKSAVEFSDLYSEGVIGLFQGLAKYNVHGAQTSATNYLGQWILTTMRRNTEDLDNDFGVPYEAAERHRRIRALRSRLTNDLGREPADDEMIDAWGDDAYHGSRKIGRVNKQSARPKKVLTLAQLAEERDLRSRVGHTARLAMSGSTEADGPLVEFAHPLVDQHTSSDTADSVIERGAQQGLSEVLTQTLTEMRLPAAQREVITRRWGLLPHGREESARDISRALTLHRERVGRVIDAFTGEMSRPGGAFHKVCSTLTGEELADLGLGWVPATLGDYHQVPAAHRSQPLPEVLRQPLTPRGKTAPPPPPEPTRTASSYVQAQYFCDYQGNDFVSAYENKDVVPRRRDCTQCRRPARLIRFIEVPAAR
jgi:RNA polymerase sigma factor (sigma-70 family)